MKRSLFRIGLAALAVSIVACSEVPASTEEARGVLAGVPLVLALSFIFIVVATGLIVGAIGIDRYLRSRQDLAEATEEEADADDEEEMVAGIGVGKAPVPRWLYGFYVLIPLFSLMYVFNSADFATTPDDGGHASPEPSGPVTETTIVASLIQFDLDELTFPAATDVTVHFDNQDGGVPHNFTVWETEADAAAGGDAGRIAETSTFNGVEAESVTFNTGDVGSYYFNCTIHPPMAGTIEVVDEPADGGGEAEADHEGDADADHA